MSDSKQTTWAVRSADANHLDFASLPLIGLIGVARTAAEGAAKYGRFNYMLGFPVHDLLNHAIRHIVMFLLGDRSEPHLEHAAWGLLAAIQQNTLDPELSAPHLLGPGASLTEAVRKVLADNAPALAAQRRAGVFDELSRWQIADLKEIRTLLAQWSLGLVEMANDGSLLSPPVVDCALSSSSK